ncbi:MAG TPA: hypothetical protein VJX29_11190 [Candidatus Acidoferrales bacterium]|nr:hypothetical protein [Candidatus Acidoferrales bacterium]
MRKLLLAAALMFSIQAFTQERPKVFVKPILGGGHKANTTAGVESELAKRCRTVTVTDDKDKADYILDFSANGNEFVIFNHNGDLIQRGSAVIYHKAIEKACKAMK